MMRTILIVLAMALGWIAPSQPADALGCILIGCDCDVAASDIAFADINPLQDAAVSADGQVNIHCTGLVSIGAGVVLQLDDGLWGTYSARKMRSENGDYLDYNIYQPAPNGSVVWGDGTLGSQQLQVQGGLINIGAWNASRTMQARLTASASVKPGHYEDTVVVRVIW
jgi:spore coat protein U-like protein